MTASMPAPVTNTTTSRRRSISSSSGFTLIEILMVLLLLGIITRIAVVQFTNFTYEAKAAVTRERMNSIKVAIVGDSRFVSHGKHTKPGFEFHCLAAPAAITDLT